jgi:N-acetylglucosamine-6-phosphate deacetylase
MIISGPTIYTESSSLSDTALLIEKGAIADFQKSLFEPSTEHFQFPSDHHLVPGFIDLHIHGSHNVDVMDASQAALITLSNTLAIEGVTGFLGTTMTDSIERIEAALMAMQIFQQDKTIRGAHLLGAHLEGPFISRQKCGAQNASHILEPRAGLIASWIQRFPKLIQLMTLAPEVLLDTEVLPLLQAHNILCAMGHTQASFDEGRMAIDQGFRYTTHLFNAMRLMHHREPGLALAALLDDRVYVECIADGLHLHAGMLQLIVKAKPIDKIILITDAMRAKCMGEGCFDLGGQQVIVKDSAARLTDGTLAGSIISMNTAFKNMLRLTSCHMIDALKMVSANPAKAINCFATKGSIEQNKDADFVILDANFSVVMTVVSGKCVYRHNT